MRTQRVGTLDIDQSRLAADLELSAGFEYSDAYSEYLCGGPWKSCVLWAAGGDSGDGLVTNYDFVQACAPTEYGKRLPYIAQLIEQTFDLRHLTFARLAVISNSVIIPHRDLLELDDVPVHARNAHRVHVPLRTTEEAYFSQDDVVYRMGVGEVWFFDASCVHTAASFSEEDRIHLMLDFSAVADGSKLVSLPHANGNGNGNGIPADSVCPREPLTSDERDALLALARVINLDNYRDVFSIVIKEHYRRDGGPEFIWDTLRAIADASGDDAVRTRVHEEHEYFLIKRDP